MVLISITRFDSAALEDCIQEIGVLDQLLLRKLLRASPSFFIGESIGVSDPIEGRLQHLPVVIVFVVDHYREVLPSVQEVGEHLALAFRPLLGLSCLQYLLRQSMGVDGPLRHLYLCFEVLVPLLDRGTFLEADDCNLDRVIEVEASRLGVQGVEVRQVLLLERPLPSLRVLPLSRFLLLAHLAKAKALLLARVEGCLCLALRLLSLMR